MIMDREMKTDKKGAKAQTRFVVTREFGGTQTMQEAFERLIEKKTECVRGERPPGSLAAPA